MRSDRRLDAGLGQAMADLYTRSPDAAAVAAMARHLGLGELRLAATTPHVAYVVDPPADLDAPTREARLDALSAYAIVTLRAQAGVLALDDVPAPRRASLWAGAPVVRSAPSRGAPAGGVAAAHRKPGP